MIESNFTDSLNEETLGRLKYRIFFMVKENYKTKQFSDSEMVKKIRTLIDELVRQEESK